MVLSGSVACDTVDVAGNLFMGREPMKSVLGIPLLSTRPKCTPMPERCLKGWGSLIPDTRLLVRNLSGGQRQLLPRPRGLGPESADYG